MKVRSHGQRWSERRGVRERVSSWVMSMRNSVSRSISASISLTPVADKARGMSARACPAIADREQFLNVVEPQAEPLGTSDETEPFQVILAVDPIAAAIPLGRREQL